MEVFLLLVLFVVDLVVCNVAALGHISSTQVSTSIMILCTSNFGQEPQLRMDIVHQVIHIAPACHGKITIADKWQMIHDKNHKIHHLSLTGLNSLPC